VRECGLYEGGRCLVFLLPGLSLLKRLRVGVLEGTVSRVDRICEFLMCGRGAVLRALQSGMF
jgi:hypothetical protein